MNTRTKGLLLANGNRCYCLEPYTLRNESE